MIMTLAAGTLTGGISLISKTEVETSKLWAVYSITMSQYLNAKGELTLPPALTCALELEVASKSQAGMYGMKSVALVLVDVDVEGPS